MDIVRASEDIVREAGDICREGPEKYEEEGWDIVRVAADIQ